MIFHADMTTFGSKDRSGHVQCVLMIHTAYTLTQTNYHTLQCCVCQCDRQSNTHPDASQLPSNHLFTSMVMLLKAATKKTVKKGMMSLKMKVFNRQQKGFSRLSVA